MIANFLNSPEFKKKFEIKFIYRRSDEYEKGLFRRLKHKDDYDLSPIYLFNTLAFNYSKNRFISIFQKIFTVLPILLSKYFSILANTFILFGHFKKINPDIIHINNGGYPAASSCYSAVFAAKFLGVEKIVYVVNNMAEGYKHPFRWFDYALDIFVVRWVSVFITGSSNAGHQLKKVLRLRESQHRVINNGIMPRKVLLEKKCFLKKYSMSYSNKIIASVIANLEPRKGHIYLLRAIKKINEENKSNEFFFVIEGEGPLKNQIDSYINENDLYNVKTIERVENIFDLINASDFIILPSISHEDFPNVVVEAFSLGKPVIGSKIAGIPEQIDHDINGILVSPKKVEELTGAIQLLKDKSLIHSYGKNAKIKFDSYYNVNIAVNNYVKLYDN